MGGPACGGSHETDLERLERTTQNNESLNLKAATIPLGSTIAVVRKRMGKPERHEASPGAANTRTEYLHYGQWQFNFTAGKLVAVYKYKP